MAAWLTEQDRQNYGDDLLDVSQRAALHAVAPALQNLEQQNAELQRRLAREARHRLDQQVAAAVPDYQTIDRNPDWHRWLLQLDSYTGLPRQQLLNDAIASGSAQRVRAFFEGFRREAGSAQEQASAPGRTRSAPSTRGRVYTRAEIAQFYEQRRKGLWDNREAEWARLEHELIAAGRENRILGAVDWHGK